VIQGGRTPEYLRLNPRLLEIVCHFAKEKTDPSPQSATAWLAEFLTVLGTKFEP